jgi:anti-anti-sigma factor
MGPEKRAIEVDLAPDGASPFSAVVKLWGEHDLGTSDELHAALAPLYGDLLVDLTECEFVDSTVIGLVLRKYQELKRDGHRMELVVEPGSPVGRALEIVDIRQFVTVRERISSAPPLPTE